MHFQRNSRRVLSAIAALSAIGLFVGSVVPTLAASAPPGTWVSVASLANARRDEQFVALPNDQGGHRWRQQGRRILLGHRPRERLAPVAATRHPRGGQHEHTARPLHGSSIPRRAGADALRNLPIAEPLRMQPRAPR